VYHIKWQKLSGITIMTPLQFALQPAKCADRHLEKVYHVTAVKWRNQLSATALGTGVTSTTPQSVYLNRL